MMKNTATVEYVESIIDTVREPLIVLDQDLRMVSVISRQSLSTRAVVRY